MARFRTASALLLAAFLAAAPAGKRPVDLVDPFIGTGGHGHTFPGPCLPFGFAQPGPDTRLTGWDGCSGYHGSDRVIYGFSQTHLSGTGCSDYGDILLLPATGPAKLRSGYAAKDEEAPRRDPAGYGSAFRKETEQAVPGYYRVELDDYGVQAELTSTLRAAFHRYTFRKAEGAHVLLDLDHRGRVLEAALRVVDDHTVEGLRRVSDWAQDRPVHFVARFSRPFRAELAADDRIREGARSLVGTHLKAVLHFDLRPGETVMAKVGISAVDGDGARRNLDREIPDWDFAGVRAGARKAWDRVLGRARISGGPEERQRVFYTALYHAFLQPGIFTDVDGRYLGRDRGIHRAEGYTQRTVFSLWDTFRAAHPLYTLLDPASVHDFIGTFLAQARQGGALPVWELWGNETNCMIANHAIPVLVDAWLKGFRGFDGEEAYRAARAAATATRRGLEAYQRDGLVSMDQSGESVSKTLEFAYDDWCVAQFALALGKREDYAFFLRRSQAYQHLLDPETGLMRPRSGGRWKTPFDPFEVDGSYTEADAWQYSFFVPQDVQGHMARLGGPEAYAAKLDALFSAPSRTTGREQSDISGMVGQYAHGNEPSHHMAYLYAYAGQAWKTQALVRRLMDEMYQDAPDGLIGNEDCGQMSAWFVLSALGFYPANPCGGDYVIGSPLFPEASLRLGNGRTFTVRRRGEGPYIQSATRNGRPWTRAWIRHGEILKGGELAFVMGTSPNPAWGTAPGDRPRSAIEAFRVQPAPWVAGGAPRFEASTRVTLASADPAAAIRYTLDGSAPGPESPRYGGPIELRESATMRFAAFREGFAPSPAVSARFERSAPSPAAP